eukprot:scpid67266/ scgid12596/ 
MLIYLFVWLYVTPCHRFPLLAPLHSNDSSVQIFLVSQTYYAKYNSATQQAHAAIIGRGTHSTAHSSTIHSSTQRRTTAPHTASHTAPTHSTTPPHTATAPCTQH